MSTAVIVLNIIGDIDSKTSINMLSVGVFAISLYLMKNDLKSLYFLLIKSFDLHYIMGFDVMIMLYMMERYLFYFLRINLIFKYRKKKNKFYEKHDIVFLCLLL